MEAVNDMEVTDENQLRLEAEKDNSSRMDGDRVNKLGWKKEKIIPLGWKVIRSVSGIKELLNPPSALPKRSFTQKRS